MPSHIQRYYSIFSSLSHCTIDLSRLIYLSSFFSFSFPPHWYPWGTSTAFDLVLPSSLSNSGNRRFGHGNINVWSPMDLKIVFPSNSDLIKPVVQVERSKSVENWMRSPRAKFGTLDSDWDQQWFSAVWSSYFISSHHQLHFPASGDCLATFFSTEVDFYELLVRILVISSLWTHWKGRKVRNSSSSEKIFHHK